MPSLSTDVLTEVLQGGSSIPEIAQKLSVTLAGFLDWFFTEPVQTYIAKYRAANHLIAQVRASVHAGALIDRLRQQMGHPDPSLSIRAASALSRFVLREMPHHSRKSTPETEQARRTPLPEQPGYAAGIDRDENQRIEQLRAAKDRVAHAPQPASPTSASQQAASPDSIARRPQPPVTPSVIPPSPHAHPAPTHPARHDATPQPHSSAHSPDRPTQPQTPPPAREPFPLPAQSLHAPADRTTPHTQGERAASAA